MKIIRYVHDRKLGARPLSRPYTLASLDMDNTENLTVISFSDCLDRPADETYIVNGCSRFFIADLQNVALVNVQNDSAFYAHMLWDITHQMPAGGKLYIREKIRCETLLERGYYREAFTESPVSVSGFRVYQKNSPLAASRDKGLTQWSFCIPVGPEEPTFINACVERILQLDIAEKEIILCGTPHPDFRFFEQVKIVGQDIPAPPVHITRKKNLLVESARYPNLCILHDRVLLALNFYQAVQRFGDDYPMTGFQSFYFTDQYNLVPRKYSDFNTIEQDLTKELSITAVTQKDTSLISKLFYCYQHPARSQFGHDYLTGSLYICKKSVWQHSPQNEQLYWNDYEDIEQGIRCSYEGIPTIINPWSITQSMNARSVIHYYGYVAVKDYRGNKKMSRCRLEMLPFIPKKPLFRLSDEQARNFIYHFAKKYGASQEILLCISSSAMNGLGRFLLIKKVIKDIKVRLEETSEFLRDFSRWILCEDMAPNELVRVTRVMNSSASPATKKSMLLGCFILNNQLSHSWFFSPFYKNNDDWFIKKRRMICISNFISACYLKYLYWGAYFPMSVMEVARLLNDSTPYQCERGRNGTEGRRDH